MAKMVGIRKKGRGLRSKVLPRAKAKNGEVKCRWTLRSSLSSNKTQPTQEASGSSSNNPASSVQHNSTASVGGKTHAKTHVFGYRDQHKRRLRECRRKNQQSVHRVTRRKLLSGSSQNEKADCEPVAGPSHVKHKSVIRDSIKTRQRVKKKQCRWSSEQFTDVEELDHLNKLSLEILCRIMKSLPLIDIMKLECLNHHLQEAVTLHLRLLTRIDFTENVVYGWMPNGFTDITFTRFLWRCPDVERIYGLHPIEISKRRQRGGRDGLSIPGLVTALLGCRKLKAVETSDIFLLDALLTYLPHIFILNTFQNRGGCFPIPSGNTLSLTRSVMVSTLNLCGVVLPTLPPLDRVEHLHLQWVCYTDPHPFREFAAPRLRTFIMRNCAGPVNALKYVPLITGLAGGNLNRLELVRVPFLGGLFHHVVEDSWRLGGFRHLRKILFGACKHALEVDLGYLTITCASRLNELCIQPSLTKDSFFASLLMADVSFAPLSTLCLGYIDDFPEPGKYTSEELVALGLADYTESPAMITDAGMYSIGRVFTHVETVSVYNCPHLHLASAWISPAHQHLAITTNHGGTCDERPPFCRKKWSLITGSMWSSNLSVLELRRCHALRLNDFCRAIPMMHNLTSLTLEQMFREPPKGCSRVGLSAGTGLGVSSALVQNTNQDVAAANQDLANNNPPAAPANHDVPLDQPLVVNPPPAPANQILEVPANQVVAEAAAANQDALDDPDIENFMANHDADNMQLDGEHGDNLNAADGDGILCACENDNGYQVYVIQPGTSGHHRHNSGSSSKSGLSDGRTCLPGCSKQPLCNHSDSSDDEYEQRRSMRLRSSARNTDVKLNYGSCSDSKRTEGGKNLNGRSVGKGKGNKKAMPKRSAINNSVNQSCQATSEEIRETTKKAKEKEEAARVRPNTRSGPSYSILPAPPSVDDEQPSTSAQAGSSGSGSVPSGKRQLPKKLAKQKPNMVDRATSTSDPVIEEDHIQVLTINSNSLTNLTLREVGITDLVIDNCPVLESVSGTACRVLHDAIMKKTPMLRRVSFVQCCKLRNEDLVDEISLQSDDCSRTIYLRPMKTYNRFLMEEVLLERLHCDYNVCIIHDYDPDPERTLHNRTQVVDWVTEIEQDIYLSFYMEESSDTKKFAHKSLYQYPWGRRLYRMQGSGRPGDKWDLITDIPWLQTLVQSQRYLHQTNKDKGAEYRDCIYNPRDRLFSRHGNYHDLAEVMAEAHELQEQPHQRTLVVYINMCDISGIPTVDKYV